MAYRSCAVKNNENCYHILYTSIFMYTCPTCIMDVYSCIAIVINYIIQTHWSNFVYYMHVCYLVWSTIIKTFVHSSITVISKVCTHKDLGITISSNLSWESHYTFILAKAYKTLGLLWRSFSSNITIQSKKQLYLSLVRS